MNWWKRFTNVISSKNNEKIVALLSKVSIKKACDRKGNGLLHYAAKTNNKFLANYLIEAGCDLNLKNRDGETPLMVSIMCTQLVMVRLLAKAGANLKEVNENDHTPLQISLLCHKGNKKKQNFKIIKILVEAGSNVNERCSNYMYETLLHYAIRNEYNDIIDYLLKAGALVELENLNGNTPLSYAIKYNNYECIKRIINAGANINYFNCKQATYLHQAAGNFQADILELLLDNGADINATNCRGQSALHYCLSKVYTFKRTSLFDESYDDFLIQQEPIRIKERRRCVQILLEYDTKINLEVRRSSLNLAISFHHSNIVCLLTEYGATFDYNFNSDSRTLKSCPNYNSVVELMKSFVLAEAQNHEVINLKFYHEVLKDYHFESIKEKLLNLYSLCSKELSKMKEMRINGSVTLFQLMIKNKFRLYMRNESIVHVLAKLKEQIISDYPLYGSLLYERFDIETTKKPLLNAASLGLGKILKWNKQSLPFIFDNILYFLSKRDLKNLALLA